MCLRDIPCGMATEGEEPNVIRESKRGLCGPSPLERLLVTDLSLTEGINVVDLWCFLLGSKNRSSFGPRGLWGVWYFLFPFNSSHNIFSSFAWSSCLLKSFTEEKQREITTSFHLVINLIKLNCDPHNLCLEINIIEVNKTNPFPNPPSPKIKRGRKKTKFWQPRGQ